MTQTRREFVVSTAATLAACAGFRRGAAPIPRLGVQLYTVRQLIRSDPERTLSEISAAGYEDVELWEHLGIPAPRLSAMLVRAGLRAPSGHFDFETIRRDFARVIAAATAAGNTDVVCAWIDAEHRTPDGYRRVADVFNRTGDAAARSGLRFCYHTHDFIFRPLSDGTRPIDLLLRECEPRTLAVQLDVFWARAAGADPNAELARLRGRCASLHVKDMDARGAEVDVGDGVVDWPAVIAAARESGARYFFVERDDPPDPMTTIRRSADALRSLSSRPR